MHLDLPKNFILRENTSAWPLTQVNYVWVLSLQIHKVFIILIFLWRSGHRMEYAFQHAGSRVNTPDNGAESDEIGNEAHLRDFVVDEHRRELEPKVDCWVMMALNCLLRMSELMDHVFISIDVVLSRSNCEIVRGKGIVWMTTSMLVWTGELSMTV